MDYDRQVSCSGDSVKALEMARAVFASNGFKISSIRDASFEARRKGILDGKREPIVGVSRAAVSVRGQRMRIQAEFGNVRITCWFIAALIVGLLVAPLIYLVLKRMTTRSLDRLLENMSAAAKDE